MQDHSGNVAGNVALVPLVLTVPVLSLALLAPFAGVVVDRLGRKRLLVAAAVLYALFGTAPLWLDSLYAVLVSRVLLGVAEAAVMTACTTLIGDYCTGRVRDRYLAPQTMCASASATVFFAVGGALGTAGWRAPFWLYAVGLPLALATARALPDPQPSAADGQPHAGAEPRPFPVRRMAGICLLTVFGAVVFCTVPVEMSYLLDDLGVGLDDLGVGSTGVIGAATAIAGAATVAGSVVFPRLTDGPRRRLPAVLLLCGTGFLLMGFADSVPLLVAGAVVNCVGTGLLLTRCTPVTLPPPSPSGPDTVGPVAAAGRTPAATGRCPGRSLGPSYGAAPREPGPGPGRGRGRPKAVLSWSGRP
ncbi:MFS transporter [Streptomyces sp. NPDC000348]|uniref:MFS transporter n=1 Tax=Streptomyces sp. NPDC000348 TaxID=3364538 RepID=UPI0036875158